MHWGHAKTRVFLHWEELSVALDPNADYDARGYWSGKAIVKDDVLYLIYTSVCMLSDKTRKETVSVAYSKDGISFNKYKNNPVIREVPPAGTNDFRDPAVVCINGVYYCTMATGKNGHGRLLLFESRNLLSWEYKSVLLEHEEPSRYFECPILLPLDREKYFFGGEYSGYGMEK